MYLVDIVGGMYDHLVRRIIFTFDNDYDISVSSDNYEGNGYMHKLDVSTVLH